MFGSGGCSSSTCPGPAIRGPLGPPLLGNPGEQTALLERPARTSWPFLYATTLTPRGTPRCYTLYMNFIKSDTWFYINRGAPSETPRVPSQAPCQVTEHSECAVDRRKMCHLAYGQGTYKPDNGCMNPKQPDLKEQEMTEPPSLTTVAILGGDPIVGQAIEALLRAAGYDTRFLVGPPTEASRGSLAGSRLLLLAPGGLNGHREDFLSDEVRGSAAMEIPVLELITVLDEAESLRDYQIPWPCRPEHLQERIRDALLTAPATL